jgi:hypothetical protein
MKLYRLGRYGGVIRYYDWVKKLDHESEDLGRGGRGV